jgi:predicted ATPase/DNA-binding winged helix-turn-helix (wHTH) protein
MNRETEAEGGQTGDALSFGTFSLFPKRRALLKGTLQVQIGSHALDLLIALVERSGQPLSKQELIDQAWPGMFVEESNLRVHIANLRKMLGDTPPFRYIATVQNRGYCFVAPTSRTLAGALASDKPAERRHHLPNLRPHMIGRASVVDALAPSLLQRRLLTIVGPGGIGKSTVALALANVLQADFQGGACFVDLAPLASPDLVPGAIASTLEIALRTDDPAASLVAFLRDKHILLILDSCEHVVESAAIIAEAILNNAPGLRILATSREPLQAPGEHLYLLAPLALPPESAGIQSEQAMTFSAVQLFVAQATAALDGFVLTDGDAAAVADICRKLDGIPLAIELAASRINVLGVAGLAARLDDRLPLLSHGRRTARSRHRTLNATLAWSYDFLEPDEQAVLRRLAIFTGPFTLEAARSVAAFKGLNAAAIIDHIANLATKSLIIATIDETGTLYRLLDTTRAYASEKLAAADETNQAALQHATYLLDALPEVEKTSSAPFSIYRRLIDDVRAALERTFSSSGNSTIGAALVASSVSLWIHLSLVGECQRWVDRALGAVIDMDPSLRMRLMAARATVLHYTNRGKVPVEMQEAWASVLEIAAERDDIQYSLRALWGLWAFGTHALPFPEILPLADRFCTLAKRSANPVDSATGDRMLGLMLHYLGDQSSAQSHLERSLARLGGTHDVPRPVHFQYNQALAARAYLPRVLWLRGMPDTALAAARSVVDDAITGNHALSLCLVLIYAAPVALLAGKFDEAKRFVDLLLDTSRTHAIDLWVAEGSCLEGAVLTRSGQPQHGRSVLLGAMNGPPYMESNIYRVEMLIELAHAYSCNGDFRQGIAILDEALAASARREERWSMAELLRMRAEMLLSIGAPGSELQAEELLLQALDWAHKQGALSWELRSASSLARLRRKQGRVSEGRACLEPVYGRFKEGFDSADLVAARELLNELSVQS